MKIFANISMFRSYHQAFMKSKEFVEENSEFNINQIKFLHYVYDSRFTASRKSLMYLLFFLQSPGIGDNFYK